MTSWTVCSPPRSSVQGVSQVRILEWVAIFFFRGSFQPKDWTCLSCTGRWILYCLSQQGSPVFLPGKFHGQRSHGIAKSVRTQRLKNNKCLLNSLPQIFRRIRRVSGWCWNWQFPTASSNKVPRCRHPTLPGWPYVSRSRWRGRYRSVMKGEEPDRRLSHFRTGGDSRASFR